MTKQEYWSKLGYVGRADALIKISRVTAFKHFQWDDLPIAVKQELSEELWPQMAEKLNEKP